LDVGHNKALEGCRSAFTQFTNTLEGTDGVGSWDDMKDSIANHKACKIFRATPF
jgi:hypothetical protein